ncbi:MAG: endonuclease/exonuclease/phosphatase family protein [Pirellulaceae bacterium]
MRRFANSPCYLRLSMLFFTGAIALSVLSLAGRAIGQTSAGSSNAVDSLVPAKAGGVLRLATFNVSLNRPQAGKLAEDLSKDDSQARSIAAVIRAVRPDVLLLCEVDYSTESNNAETFASEYLAAAKTDKLGGAAIEYEYVYSAPVNTGEASGLDLNDNGKTSDPEDAWGYGRFPGQYGMAVLSRYPIATDQIRTFQTLRWSVMPDALRPRMPDGESYYDDATWKQLRISSKSFWDVPIELQVGEAAVRLHLLASHPTPPAFDGPEDRNGCRNHDEIRLLVDYISGAAYFEDDSGKNQGLEEQAAFFVAGDLNSDPFDGGSRPEAIRDLLNHSRIATMDPPSSQGAVVAAKEQAKANLSHQGEAAFDTGDFNDRSVGNLRIDYALPSSNFRVLSNGVFWPSLKAVKADMREAVTECLKASDHHLVWVDVELAK